jgi:hypothetical protein
MSNRFIHIFIIIALIFLPFRFAYSLSFNFIGKIRSAFDAFGGINRSIGVVPFGGKVSDTGRGCVIDYYYAGFCGPFPCIVPGIAIPLPASTSFDINNVLPTQGEVFTLAFISKVVPKDNDVNQDDWALGLSWSPFKPVIDKINDALGTITIPVGSGVLKGFKLECTDDDDDIVLIVGSN